MRSCQRARWAALLTCGALIAVAAPANAQTQQTDTLALAHTLADGFTAIDARRPEAQAAVDVWLDEQGRCAEPKRIRSRFRRSIFTAARWTGLHIVALNALAPELEQLTGRLRALPVTDSAIRGGIREVLLDYRNARQLMKVEPPDLCEVVRSLRAGEPWAKGIGFSEDVRGSRRALGRRGSGIRAAQRALLRVEVDPRLARSLDSVFEHATAGLYRSRLQTREPLAPPFPIVTDAASLERLRAEAAAVAGTTDSLFAAQRDVVRRLNRAGRRINRCRAAVLEGIERRPRGLSTLLIAWSLGELSAATERPLERFQADLAAVDVADPLMRELRSRVSENLGFLADLPRTNICSRVRAWRRAGWARGFDVGEDPLTGDFIGGELSSGLRLDDEVIDRAVLRRRGVARRAAAAILAPVDVLIGDPAPAQISRTQAVASSVRAARAAVTSRGVWRIAQAMSAEAIGSAGAR
jgi:hypothetical protein